jgi:hypothetical protein
MSLTRSLITQQHRPILDQLLVRLGLRQGQQIDRVVDHAAGFIEGICKIVGYSPVPEEWKDE